MRGRGRRSIMKTENELFVPQDKQFPSTGWQFSQGLDLTPSPSRLNSDAQQRPIRCQGEDLLYKEQVRKFLSRRNSKPALMMANRVPDAIQETHHTCNGKWGPVRGLTWRDTCGQAWHRELNLQDIHGRRNSCLPRVLWPTHLSTDGHACNTQV